MFTKNSWFSAIAITDSNNITTYIRRRFSTFNSDLTNPKYLRSIKGQKTDDKDTTWIADLFKFDIVPSSFIPPKDIRMLRELFRYRFKLRVIAQVKKTDFKMPLPYPISH